MSSGTGTLWDDERGSQRTTRSRGPSQATRDAVIRRAQGRCERCGTSSGFGWSVHHRQPRGMGGSRMTSANSVTNLMLLCGSGTTGCHGAVESYRKQAVAEGFIVPRPALPDTTPVLYRRIEWCLLTSDGSVEPWNPDAVWSSSSDSV